ncbi:MAG: hypothetical protein HDQ87_08460 [Clostridia bacterium]|nr:hypothetical protein [Clostridia bacterium]
MRRTKSGQLSVWRCAALGAFAAIALCGCTWNEGVSMRSPYDDSQQYAEAKEERGAPLDFQQEEAIANGEDTSYVLVPETLLEIPKEYSASCDRPGTLERLEYNTFEAFSYEDRSKPLVKDAIVYVPAAYDPLCRYNVVYLMHGGWSNQTTFLGTPQAPTVFKNQIDHAMAAGIIEPCLIVCPTYNNTSPDDAADYALALELTARYPQELTGDLMPAVESRYSTYAENVSPEGLMASRDHRAFMGFSMGSVTTWRVFENCMAYFRYFAPASGNAGSGVYWADVVTQQGFKADDFLIIAATGTNDFNGRPFASLMEDMAQQPIFHEGFSGSDVNLVFRIGEGEGHDSHAASRYMYNAMACLWHSVEPG